MQPVYQNPNQPTTEGVYRTNTILWAAMLVSQFMFLVLLFFARRELFNFEFGENAGITSGSAGNLFGTNPLLIVLAVLGLTAFALSFVIKSRLLKYAIDNKSVEFVQKAHIVAYALCDAVSVIGLLAAFAFDTRLCFLWFAAGIIGILLHFPRRENFHAAAFTGIK